MQKKNVIILAFCLAFVFRICAQTSDVKHESKQSENFEVNEYYQNPFKGFSTFVFFARFPAADRKEEDKINLNIKNDLSPFGKVHPSSLLVQTDGGEAIDFKDMTSGCFLDYDITDLTDINGKKLGIIKATLTLTTQVGIRKTMQNCMPVVWSQSCFLKGETKKNLTESISNSLKCLLEGFQKEYSQVNNEKPVFNFYQS